MLEYFCNWYTFVYYLCNFKKHRQLCRVSQNQQVFIEHYMVLTVKTLIQSLSSLRGVGLAIQTAIKQMVTHMVVARTKRHHERWKCGTENLGFVSVASANALYPVHSPTHSLTHLLIHSSDIHYAFLDYPEEMEKSNWASCTSYRKHSPETDQQQV